jgi:hypothetical protein
MNSSDEVAILRQTYTFFSTHRDALKDVLQDLDQRELTVLDLENLSRQDRRLLDQFAYRYTRLQDDMGARLLRPTMQGWLVQDCRVGDPPRNDKWHCC